MILGQPRKQDNRPLERIYWRVGRIHVPSSESHTGEAGCVPGFLPHSFPLSPSSCTGPSSISTRSEQKERPCSLGVSGKEQKRGAIAPRRSSCPLFITRITKARGEKGRSKRRQAGPGTAVVNFPLVFSVALVGSLRRRNMPTECPLIFRWRTEGAVHTNRQIRRSRDPNC